MYLCLICKKTKKWKLGMKRYKKKIGKGKFKKVPVCCGHKMEPIK